jgi:multidrug efflux pump
LDDTLQQVTERIERKLQETKGLDFLRSYTSAGLTTIFVNLKGETTAAQVPDIWYQVRKNVGDIRHTLPAGVVGPGFNDDFGDTYGIIYGFTADGFSHRELRDYVETIRSRLLNVPDVSQIDVLGAQDEQIFVEFSTQQLAGLGIDRSALIAALQAQNAISPQASFRPGTRNSRSESQAHSSPNKTSWPLISSRMGVSSGSATSLKSAAPMRIRRSPCSA